MSSKFGISSYISLYNYIVKVPIRLPCGGDSNGLPTAKEYHNQIDFREYNNRKYCQGLPHSNDCQGELQSKEMPRSNTIKMTAREYQN